MHLPAALIAIMAGVATALPVAEADSWQNVATTSTGPQWSAVATPLPDKPDAMPSTGSRWTPAPSPPLGKPPPMPSSTNGWTNTAFPSGHPIQKDEKPPTTSSSPSKPAFSAPAADLKQKLGSPPSDACPWDFILSCGQKAYEAADTCLSIMAKDSTNCFSDSTCAAAIGSDAPTCAACYTALGKQKFITAIHDEKADDNVKPIFQAMVDRGVCDNNGQIPTTTTSAAATSGWTST